MCKSDTIKVGHYVTGIVIEVEDVSSYIHTEEACKWRRKQSYNLSFYKSVALARKIETNASRFTCFT